MGISKRVEMAKGGNFIKNAIKRPGALRKSLHIAEGKKIPKAKLDKATHSKNATLRREAILAETLKGFAHRRHFE